MGGAGGLGLGASASRRDGRGARAAGDGLVTAELLFEHVEEELVSAHAFAQRQQSLAQEGAELEMRFADLQAESKVQVGLLLQLRARLVSTQEAARSATERADAAEDSLRGLASSAEEASAQARARLDRAGAQARRLLARVFRDSARHASMHCLMLWRGCARAARDRAVRLGRAVSKWGCTRCSAFLVAWRGVLRRRRLARHNLVRISGRSMALGFASWRERLECVRSEVAGEERRLGIMHRVAARISRSRLAIRMHAWADVVREKGQKREREMESARSLKMQDMMVGDEVVGEAVARLLQLADRVAGTTSEACNRAMDGHKEAIRTRQRDGARIRSLTSSLSTQIAAGTGSPQHEALQRQVRELEQTNSSLLARCERAEDTLGHTLKSLAAEREACRLRDQQLEELVDARLQEEDASAKFARALALKEDELSRARERELQLRSEAAGAAAAQRVLKDQIQSSLAHTAQQLACYEDERCAAEAELLSYKEAYQQASAALIVAEDARLALSQQVEQVECDKWKAEVSAMESEQRLEKASEAARAGEERASELRSQLEQVQDKLWLSVHALEEAQRQLQQSQVAASLACPAMPKLVKTGHSLAVHACLGPSCWISCVARPRHLSDGLHVLGPRALLPACLLRTQVRAQQQSEQLQVGTPGASCLSDDALLLLRPILESVNVFPTKDLSLPRVRVAPRMHAMRQAARIRAEAQAAAAAADGSQMLQLNPDL